jgi:hypothetical protein
MLRNHASDLTQASLFNFQTSNFNMEGIAMAQSTTNSPLSEVVREVHAKTGNRTQTHEPRFARHTPSMVNAPDLAMPDYVKHREGTTEIGKLSAEAVVREYEAAAKEIESMGGELIERVKQCEALGRDAFAVTAELNGIAERYRAEAKRVFEHIESCSLVVAEIRNICADLKDKIDAPSAAKK